MSRVDELFAEACAGDSDAFATWMTTVERTARLSLSRFARAVDVESVLQEGFLRMWVVARSEGRALAGEDASLKYFLGVVRNMARHEARRFHREVLLPPESMPDIAAPTVTPPNPRLEEAIRECLGKLKGKPHQVMRLRLQRAGHVEDRLLAGALEMTLNTFLQNIVRARRAIETCLERRGVRLREVLP